MQTRKADDLFACGCVLAEMCAGEPIVAGPSSVSPEGANRRRGDGGGGGGGRRSRWVEGALELPPALRSAIRALTQADPDKVCVCVWVIVLVGVCLHVFPCVCVSLRVFAFSVVSG